MVRRTNERTNDRRAQLSTSSGTRAGVCNMFEVRWTQRECVCVCVLLSNACLSCLILNSVPLLLATLTLSYSLSISLVVVGAVSATDCATGPKKCSSPRSFFVFYRSFLNLNLGPFIVSSPFYCSRFTLLFTFWRHLDSDTSSSSS